MENKQVIIVGAGAAGLIAARELAREGYQVTILEARRRLGGRIHTFRDKKFKGWTEAGAEFIHGRQQTTFALLKEYKIKYHPAKGQVWHIRAGEPEKDKDIVDDHHHLLKKKLNGLKRDMPLKKFMDMHFQGAEYGSLWQSVSGFVEGYESASISSFSSMAFKKDWLEVEKWNQYRIEGGYNALIEAISKECKQLGCKIIMGSSVNRIVWKKNFIQAECTNGNQYVANKAVIAIPLGVLQNDGIRFSPSLPKKKNSLKKLGYGNVIKILMLFKTRFWEEKAVQKRLDKNLDKLFFLFSQAPVPTWWTQYPSSYALLTGWLSGPKAEKMSGSSNNEILKQAKKSLALIFETDVKTITAKLLTWKAVNWSRDEFTQGSYAYATVNAKRTRISAGKAERNTLFFAGEYLDDEPGTVEAALKSGLKTASAILKHK